MNNAVWGPILNVFSVKFYICGSRKQYTDLLFFSKTQKHNSKCTLKKD